jgi:hypothetical protein
MPQTTQCNWCGVVLNLPPGIKPGKRFKCPRCGSKFSVTEKDASSASTAPGLDDATATSAFDLHKDRRLPEDLPPSLGGGDLREAFDLPLTLGSARDIERNAGDRSSQAADAAALFDAGPARRRQTAAEARSQSRRCVTCGTGVPRGMSICSVCGTDQESGLRVGLEDDLAPQAPPPPPGAPAHVSITGILVIAGSLVLMILAIINSTRAETSIELLSWLALGMVSGFGIYAAIQFIRGKSVRLLLVALTLGAIVDVMTLIALPILQPFMQDQENIVNSIAPESADDADADVGIRPFEDRIDLTRIMIGIGLILVYALVSIYLISPSVRRYIQSHGDRGD